MLTLLFCLCTIMVNADDKNATVVANITVTPLPAPTNVTIDTKNETVPVNKTEEADVAEEIVDPDHEDKSFYPGSDDEGEDGSFTIVPIDGIPE